MTSRRQPADRTRDLFAYLEGEATANECAAIESQLRDSVELRRELDRCREMLQALGRTDEALGKVDLVSSLRRGIQTMGREQFSWSERIRRVFWPTTAAVAACAALVLALAFKGTGAEDRPEQSGLGRLIGARREGLLSR